MNVTPEVLEIVEKINAIIKPFKVILYNAKYHIHDDSLKSVDFCVIVENGDPEDIEKQIYLNVESKVPFNVIIYQKNKWDELLNDELSFVRRIIDKGHVLYEQK